MFYIFLDVKKNETCWLHFNVNFLYRHISAIYDMFDIYELAKFTGGSSFFNLLKIAF